MSKIFSTTKLAILLTAKWSAEEAKPLTNAEFTEFTNWFITNSESLESLLSGDFDTSNCPIYPARMKSLLSRGSTFFEPLDRWLESGIWVRIWSDPGYPSRLKHLHPRAPALIFGCGNPNSLSKSTLAIVGSRNASLERLQQTSAIATNCAAQGITVVSGGARGVDMAAMESALASGGNVAGILADSLLKTASNLDFRKGIQDGSLCLLSEVHPEARFAVGNAMSRNRLIYECSDAALIIECEPGTGGTWQGARVGLKNGKSVFVLKGAKADPQLEDLGAVVVNADEAMEVGRLVESVRLPVSAKVLGELKSTMSLEFD